MEWRITILQRMHPYKWTNNSCNNNSIMETQNCYRFVQWHTNTHTTHLIHCIHRSTLLYKIFDHILVTKERCSIKRGMAILNIIRGSIRMFEWMYIRVCVCVCVFGIHVTRASGEKTWKRDTISTSQSANEYNGNTQKSTYICVCAQRDRSQNRARPQQQREQRELHHI